MTTKTTIFLDDVVEAGKSIMKNNLGLAKPETYVVERFEYTAVPNYANSTLLFDIIVGGAIGMGLNSSSGTIPMIANGVCGSLFGAGYGVFIGFGGAHSVHYLKENAKQKVKQVKNYLNNLNQRVELH